MYTDELSGRGELTRDGGSASRIQVEVEIPLSACMGIETRVGGKSGLLKLKMA